MKAQLAEKAPKKRYEKPALRVVNIAPGIQTLGIGCKTAEAGVSYDNPCVSQACAAVGS